VEVLTETKALEAYTVVMLALYATLAHAAYAIALVPYWTAIHRHIFSGQRLSTAATSTAGLDVFCKNKRSLRAADSAWFGVRRRREDFCVHSVLVAGYSYGYL